jgi:hypothetical protein
VLWLIDIGRMSNLLSIKAPLGMRFLSLLVLIACSILSGCSPAKRSMDPSEHAGTAVAAQYRLDRANGRLPLQIPAESVGCTRLLMGGQLDLDGKGGFGLSLRVSEECEGSRTGEALALSGTYRLEGSRLLLDAGSAGVLKGEAASPSGVTLTLRSLVLVFSLGEDDPLEAAAELVRRQTEELAARQPPRYDCTTDSSLSRLPLVPAADTAGLGHQIAAAFPGYRLSTQAEIACRHAEPDFDPETLWGPVWSSGRPWWIWSGDFDADGLDDQLLILSHEEDPARDLLVVLFGNGTAASVTELGGWGVAVGAPGPYEVDGEQLIRIAGNLVIVIYWEKSADRYYWSDGAFRVLPASH